MTQYQKGYRFEIRTKKLMEKKDYVVFRQGKSAFPDLIVVKSGITIFIECKSHQKVPKNPIMLLTKDEREKAEELKHNTGCVFYLACRHREHPRKIQLVNV